MCDWRVLQIARLGLQRPPLASPCCQECFPHGVGSRERRAVFPPGSDSYRTGTSVGCAPFACRPIAICTFLPCLTRTGRKLRIKRWRGICRSFISKLHDTNLPDVTEPACRYTNLCAIGGIQTRKCLPCVAYNIEEFVRTGAPGLFSPYKNVIRVRTT